MPLYDYRCRKCGHTVEIRHGFDDVYDDVCSACGDPMSRVFNPAPIVFRGSGFYINDSRSKSGSGAPSAPADSKPAATESKPADASPSESQKSEKPKTESSDSAA
jgi:putative FmdB family regulatory protein